MNFNKLNICIACSTAVMLFGSANLFAVDFGITSPAFEQVVYEDTLSLEGFNNNFEEGDDLAWAVRYETCDVDPDANVAGNVANVDTEYLYEAGIFTADLDTSSLESGMYCLILNFGSGQRATREFYLVDEYAKVGGTLYMGEDGRGKSPTHAVEGVVGKVVSTGEVYGSVMVNYRTLGVVMVFEAETLEFSAAPGVGADGDMDKAIIYATNGTQIQILDRDGSELFDRGAFLVRFTGSPSDNPYEIDETPGFGGAESWVPMDRGNNHTGER